MYNFVYDAIINVNISKQAVTYVSPFFAFPMVDMIRILSLEKNDKKSSRVRDY